jgi:hypothetical protein
MTEDRLREALPPMGDVELRRDLWPAMLRRMERREWRLAWFDWAVAGLAVAWLAAFPETIRGLLVHL